MDEQHKALMNAVYARQISNEQLADKFSAAKKPLDLAISNQRTLGENRRRLERQLLSKYCTPYARILDCGCGTGRYIELLVDLPLANTYSIAGWDISDIAVSGCQSRFPAERYPFVRFELRDIVTDGIRQDEKFEVVLLIAAIEHMQNQCVTLDRIHEILVPGGKAIIGLHREFVDPFVIPTVTRRLLRLVRRRRNGPLKSDLQATWLTINEWLRKHELVVLERVPMLPQFEWLLYKTLVPFAVPGLVKACDVLARLPLSFYMSFELLVLEKPGR